MKIIYAQDNGILAQMVPAPNWLATLTDKDSDGNAIYPTEESKMVHLANKDLPTGTKYEIIDDSVDLSDRSFRNAWEYTAPDSGEKTSADLSLDDQLKYNKITQQEYDDAQ